MAKLRHLANRTKELDIFLKMAEGKHDCQILFIEGQSGMGKTSLLTRFKQRCPVQYVPFECRGVPSVATFLSEVVAELGQDRFPTFVSKVKVFVQGGVDFSENKLDAKQMSILINSDVDPATQAHRLAQLQQAFFDDLAKLKGRVVITLDNYQSANETLQAWIESKWLRAIGRRQLDNVVTVIAGQSVPDSTNNAVWGDECEHFRLTPIVEVTAWCQFCSDLQLNLPETAIKAIALGCEGHPANVHQMLSVAVESWSV